MGLRPPLPQRGRARRRLPRLPPSLPSPPRPHRTQGRLTRQPRTQPPWSVHLAAENDIEVAVIDYSNLNVIVEQPRCRSRRSGPTRRSVAYFDGGIGQG